MNDKSMTVNVTQKHIDEGWPRVCGKCPIALALKENAWTQPMVTHKQIWDCYNYGKTISNLPPEACEFIEKFDKGEKVEPFSFEISHV